MNLPRFSLRRRWIVISFVAAAALWGMITFTTIPRREDPEFLIRTAVVLTTWPGATARKVEELVTDPLEELFSSLDEVEKVRSKSRMGQSVVFVDLEDHVHDVEQVWDKVRDKVGEADLPSGVSVPFVNSDFGDTAAMVLALYERPADGSPPRRTPRELEIIADRVRDELMLLEDTAEAELLGVQEEAIYLEAPVGTWSQLGLSVDQLGKLLQARNIIASGGVFDTELGRFGLTPTGEFERVSEIGKLVVGAHGKRAPVYLSDLGVKVRRGYEEPFVVKTRFCDAEAGMSEPRYCIVISFTMKTGRNIVGLGRLVKSRLEAWRGSIVPPDVEIGIISDQPRIVQDSIADFTSNLVQAVAIVFGVAFLLIGLRIAVVMAIAIPLVMLATVGTLPFFEVQLEQMSIASLIIALGMLVDNAIEVSDNTMRFLEEGLPPREAAVRGAGQVLFPVLIATLTTVFAFLPMLTLPGNKGEYIRSIPIVVSAALLISWTVAATFTTLMSFLLLRKPAEGAKAPVAWLAARLFGALGLSGGTGPSFYDRLAALALRHKFLTTAGAALALAASLGLVSAGVVGTSFFPAAHRDQFLIDVFLPEGTPTGRTEAVTRKVEDILVELGDGPEGRRLRNFTSYVGFGGPRFVLTHEPEQTTPNYALIHVNTLSPEDVDGYIADFAERANAEVAGARVVPFELQLGPPVRYAVTLRLSGTDVYALRRYSEMIKDVFRRTEGMYDVHDSWGNLGYVLDVDVDEERANLAGVTNAAVADALRASVSGQYVTTYNEGDHRVPVYVRLFGAEGAGLERLDAVHVEGAFGKIPLDSIARTRIEFQPALIERYKQRRTIEIRARARPGYLANSLLTKAWPEIREIEAGMPPGYGIEIAGEQEKTAESQEEMGFAFQVALLLIVLVLVVQYNSLMKPVMILVTVPLAFTGAIFGLALTGESLGFMAMLGLLSLAGVTLNAGIVLVEFVEERIRERVARGDGAPAEGAKGVAGLSREAFAEEVVAGSRMRILPIMLTTLTTVGGLLPLAFFGGPLWRPLAMVLIFGLLFAAALTLFVLPAIFAIFVEHLGVRVAPADGDEPAKMEGS